MKDILVIDYDDSRIESKVLIGKSTNTNPSDLNSESDMLNNDILILSDALIELINKGVDLGYLKNDDIIPTVVERITNNIKISDDK